MNVPVIEIQILIITATIFYEVRGLRKKLQKPKNEGQEQETLTVFSQIHSRLIFVLFMLVLTTMSHWWDKASSAAMKREYQNQEEDYQRYMSLNGYKSCAQKFDSSICDAIFQEVAARRTH